MRGCTQCPVLLVVSQYGKDYYYRAHPDDLKAFYAGGCKFIQIIAKAHGGVPMFAGVDERSREGSDLYTKTKESGLLSNPVNAITLSSHLCAMG